MLKSSLVTSALGQYLGTELKIDIPKISQGECPKSVVKLCEYNDIKHLEGKLKTWADSAFTDEIQRKAVKDVLQDITRELWEWLDFSCDGTLYKKAGYLCQLKKKQENNRLENTRSASNPEETEPA